MCKYADVQMKLPLSLVEVSTSIHIVASILLARVKLKVNSFWVEVENFDQYFAFLLINSSVFVAHQLAFFEFYISGAF